MSHDTPDTPTAAEPAAQHPPVAAEAPAAEASVPAAEPEPEEVVVTPAVTAESYAAAQPVEPVVEAEPELAAEPDVVAESEPAVEATAEAEPAPVAEAVDGEAAPPAEVPNNKKWYVVKVQSGREESIKAAIERRVKVESLEEFFGQVVIPMERVTELRNGKRVVKHRKKFPGYLMVEVEYNDKILYLFRETSGVGDFVGATQFREPQPMSDREVQSMLATQPDKDDKGGKGKADGGKVVVKLNFAVGDRVRIRDGTFASTEGEVKEIIEPKDPKDTYRVRLEVSIFGRPVPVEVEYWQIDPV